MEVKLAKRYERERLQLSSIVRSWSKNAKENEGKQLINVVSSLISLRPFINF